MAASAALVVAAGLIAVGCSSNSSSPSALACPSKRGATVTGTAPAATGTPAAGWTQPDADLASTRYVASGITSANVSKLGVAWTMPLTISTAHTDGAYATTPVIVNGVVYVQDLDSNVFAIGLATGKVLWTHDYDSPNGGPDGVNVVGGVVYAATAWARPTKVVSSAGKPYRPCGAPATADRSTLVTLPRVRHPGTGVAAGGSRAQSLAGVTRCGRRGCR